MSNWAWGLFGSGAAGKKKDAPKNAILQLRQQLEMLAKREKHLQMQMDEQDTLARKYISSNKNGSYLYTVLKKYTIFLKTCTLEITLELFFFQVLHLRHMLTSAFGNYIQLPKQPYGGRSSTNTLSSKQVHR